MIHTLPLFRPLNKKLIEVLSQLSPGEWNKGTVASQWTVKDIASHLLDGNIRAISMYRDGTVIRPESEINSYWDLVDYLNKLNADWVRATKRMSHQLLLQWLEETHEAYVCELEKLDPEAPSAFSVAWAGEVTSKNWFHIAREFTEKWHHQQQIRHAVGQPGILTRAYYVPVLDTFMRALPHQYKNQTAPQDTRVRITIDSEAGGTWALQRTETSWQLIAPGDQSFQTSVVIPAEISWQLFTKAVKYETVKESIEIQGNVSLALPLLQMITVMA